MPLWRRRSGLLVAFAAGLVFLFFLGRYPVVHPDEAFFAYPAWKAAMGGSLTYAVSGAAPYGKVFWAYHGPVWPLLLEGTFRLFGFSVFVSRLPNFVAGWAGVLLLTWWLERRGFALASLVFAVLWIGDRAPLEIMCARMDGLALLCLAEGFICLDVVLRRPGRMVWGMGAGMACAMAGVVHPSCLLVAPAALVVLLVSRRVREAASFAAGVLVPVGLWLWLWRGRLLASAEQFRWHLGARNLYHEDRLHGFVRLLRVERWSGFWTAGLVVWVAVLLVWVVRRWRRGRELSGMETMLLLAAVFGVATGQNLFRSPTFPPYLVFFTAWPILALALVLPAWWGRYRVAVVAVVALWGTSVAWNGLRLREMAVNHAALARRAFEARLRQLIPGDAGVMATPDLYWSPIESGFRDAEVTTWFPEQQNVCPGCYLVMAKREMVEHTYVLPENLARRRVLYDGPAFPLSRGLPTPVVVLSPEQ